MSVLLNPAGIAINDRPRGLFPYPHPDHDKNVRTFEPFIAAGFTDEEAWAALFEDPHWCKTAKGVYGNRPTKRKKARR